MDGRLAELAFRQHGVVSLAQLAAVGLGRDDVAHRVSAGRLHRVHRGVYAVGHEHLDVIGRRLAVVVACGNGAVLSHVSAAEVWRIRGGSSAKWHVTAPGMSGGRTGPDAVVVHRTRSLVPADVTTVDGVPVTTVPRTLVDLAGMLRPHALARAIHEAEVLGLLDVRTTLEALARVPRRRGSRALRTLLGAPVDVQSETFVHAFLKLCDRYGLPRPEVGVHLHVADRLVEADIFFRRERVVVELDGERFHHTRRNFHSDRRRDAALAAEGIQTVRLTWQRVTKEARATATELERILASRR